MLPMTRTPLIEAIEFLLKDGESLESLGAKVGVSSMTIRRWAKGRIRPHLQMQKPILRLWAKRHGATR